MILSLDSVGGDKVRTRLLRRRDALLEQRRTYDAHWREIAENVQPRRIRFEKDDIAKGTKRNDRIINNRPIMALRTLQAGFMGGATSPARPWFRLVTGDPALADAAPVRSWLHDVEERLRLRFGRTNIYNGLAGAVYADLGAFGTHCGFLEEDQAEVLRYYPLPIGEYCLAVNERGVVDTVFRDVPFTVRQLVRRFGRDRLTDRSKSLYDRGLYDEYVRVLHAVYPREDGSDGRAPLEPSFVSVWLEVEGSDTSEQLLKVGGYLEFPALCPRWALTSFNEPYGSSPGMEALGDCKELQHLEKQKAVTVDKIVEPPMTAPEDMRANVATLVPSSVTYIPRSAVGSKFEPAYQVPPLALTGIKDLIADCELRIDKAFFADLWLQMLQDARLQRPTATEVDQRQQEQMLQLGPVVERLETELLNPLIDRSFRIMMRRGEIPAPPKELEGTPLRLEYLSPFTQAQKLVGVGAIERLANFTLAYGQVKPDVLDVIDSDNMIQEMASVLGVNPDLVKDDEMIAAEREARSQAMQAQAQGQAMVEATKGVKNLGSTPAPSGDNSLGALLQALGPAAGGGLPGVSDL